MARQKKLQEELTSIRSQPSNRHVARRRKVRCATALTTLYSMSTTLHIR